MANGARVAGPSGLRIADFGLRSSWIGALEMAESRQIQPNPTCQWLSNCRTASFQGSPVSLPSTSPRDAQGLNGFDNAHQPEPVEWPVEVPPPLVGGRGSRRGKNSSEVVPVA